MEETKTNITAVSRVAKTAKIAELQKMDKITFLTIVDQILQETSAVMQKCSHPTPTILAELLSIDLHTIREVYNDLITPKIDENV